MLRAHIFGTLKLIRLFDEEEEEREEETENLNQTLMMFHSNGAAQQQEKYLNVNVVCLICSFRKTNLLLEHLKKHRQSTTLLQY